MLNLIYAINLNLLIFACCKTCIFLTYKYTNYCRQFNKKRRPNSLGRRYFKYYFAISYITPRSLSFFCQFQALSMVSSIDS